MAAGGNLDTARTGPRITRRDLVAGAAGVGATLALGGCGGGGSSTSRTTGTASVSPSSLLAGVEAYAHQLVGGPNPRAVGCAYAAIDGTQQVAGAAGQLSADAGAAQPARADSLFEIGSVTKVFTTTLLAQTIEPPQQHITLTTPVGPYLPAGITNPEVKALTFGELASYSSCLVTAAPGQNLATYTVPQLAQFLNGPDAFVSGCTPGASYFYSNLAVGLLGYTLGTIWNSSWDELLRQNITRPLQMPDTVRTPDGAQSARLATGYGPNGPARAIAGAPFLGGGGVLKSTANDMLRFLAAQLDPSRAPGTLSKAISATQIKQNGGAGRPSVGLGWFLESTTSDQSALSKNGGTRGFGAYIAFVPAARRGAFIVTNMQHLTGGHGIRPLLGIGAAGGAADTG
jgi:D-alanyl-D-alanine-carboxypeptidase/D-alanyl-D-alanine-endopeptidase